MDVANFSMSETIFDDPVSSAVATELAKSAPGILTVLGVVPDGAGGEG